MKTLWADKDMCVKRITVPGYEGRVFDMAVISWGWGLVSFDAGRAVGHALDINGQLQVGDWLISKADGGGRTLYRIMTISYFQDPKDMFQATLRHIAEEPSEVVKQVFGQMAGVN